MAFSSYSRFHYKLALGAAVFSLAAGSASACSVCGCSLCSDWAVQGFESSVATDVFGRFEYIDQTQLRSGTGTVDRNSITYPTDQEIQQQTLTRGYWIGVDHVFNQNWGLTAELPYYDRFHTTIAPGDTEISSSLGRGIGDLRVVGRYQEHSTTDSWNIIFGFKAPTGKTDQTFFSGPQAGELLDRGLQLGTGSWNGELGASYFRRLATAWDSFAQITLDQPLTRKDDFRPSAQVAVNVGIRWLNTSRFTPLLQMNARWDSRELGANGDYDNSGDSVVAVSPGLTAEITRKVNAYLYVQLPVYERVNGYQIEPHWQLSTGIRWRL